MKRRIFIPVINQSAAPALLLGIAIMFAGCDSQQSWVEADPIPEQKEEVPVLDPCNAPTVDEGEFALRIINRSHQEVESMYIAFYVQGNRRADTVDIALDPLTNRSCYRVLPLTTTWRGFREPFVNVYFAPRGSANTLSGTSMDFVFESGKYAFEMDVRTDTIPWSRTDLVQDSVHASDTFVRARNTLSTTMTEVRAGGASFGALSAGEFSDYQPVVGIFSPPMGDFKVGDLRFESHFIDHQGHSFEPPGYYTTRLDTSFLFRHHTESEIRLIERVNLPDDSDSGNQDDENLE